MDQFVKVATRGNSGHLRFVGAPSLLALVVAVAAACGSDQTEDSARAGQAVAATGVLLSEVLFDPGANGDATATDSDYQYIELQGSAGGTLENHYVLWVDGRDSQTPSTQGKVLGVVNLGAACSGVCAIGASGRLVIGPKLAAGFPIPSDTTRVASGAAMPNTGADESDNLSILVVTRNTPITTSDDIDSANTADTATIDLSGVTVVDAIGWSEAGNLVYGGVRIKQNTASPNAIVRIDGTTTAMTAASWFYGEMAGGAVATTKNISQIAPAVTGTDLPAGVTAVTPGLPNTVAGMNYQHQGTAGAAGAAGAPPVATGGAVNGGAGGAAAGAAGEPPVITTGGTPSATGGAPAVTGGAPAVTGGAPAVTGGAPAVTGGAPAVTGGAPAVTGGAPSVAGAAGMTGTTVVTTGGTVATGGAAATGGVVAATGGSSAKGGGTTAAAGKKSTTTATGAVGGETAGEGDDEEESSGCGCRTAGTAKTPVSSIAMVMGLAVAFLSRRRRRS